MAHVGPVWPGSASLAGAAPGPRCGRQVGCIRLRRPAISPTGRVLVQVVPAVPDTSASRHRDRSRNGVACRLSLCWLCPAGRGASGGPLRPCPAAVSWAGGVLPSRPSPCPWLSHAPSTLRDTDTPAASGGFPCDRLLSSLCGVPAVSGRSRWGFPSALDASLPACHGLRTPADLPLLAISEGLCCLRERANPRRPPSAMSKRYQHCRGHGHPCGLQDTLSTLRPSCSPCPTAPPWTQDAIRVGGSSLPDRDFHPARDAKLFLARERWRSPAAESGSGADAVGSQVQRLVRRRTGYQAPHWHFRKPTAMCSGRLWGHRSLPKNYDGRSHLHRCAFGTYLERQLRTVETDVELHEKVHLPQ